MPQPTHRAGQGPSTARAEMTPRPALDRPRPTSRARTRARGPDTRHETRASRQHPEPPPGRRAAWQHPACGGCADQCRSRRAFAAGWRARGTWRSAWMAPPCCANRYNLLVHLPEPGVVVRSLRRRPRFEVRNGSNARSRSPGRSTTPDCPWCLPAREVEPGLTATMGSRSASGSTSTCSTPRPIPPKPGGAAPCHDALESYEPAAPRLPGRRRGRGAGRSVGRGGHDSAQISATSRPSGDGSRTSSRPMARRFSSSDGDAHLGNVLASAAGPLWAIGRTTIAGPREWDLACALASGSLHLATTTPRAER